MKKLNYIFTLIFIFILVLILSACGKEVEVVDPHAGQEYIYDGYGYVWMTPLEGIDRSPFTVDDFIMNNDTPVYTGNEYTILKGIDVSEFQHEISWNTVKSYGLDFAIIRCGYRGYTEGGLHEDIYFKRNMEGAAADNIDIGIYFTTQAITVAEAIEEANYVLNLINGYKISLPVFLDWERNYTDEARAENIDVETLTNCAIAFCQTIKNAGYDTGIYYNRTIGYYRYDLTRLTDFLVWFSLPVTPPDVTYPSFMYRMDYWQYSINGTVPGIPTEVDLDYMFIKNQPQT